MKAYDEHFIQQCSNGNKTAQRKLFEELFAPMYRISNRYITNSSEAEDCVMKAFLKVFSNISKFKYTDDNSLFFWIRRIVVNEALMLLRKKHSFHLSLEEEHITTGIENEAIQKLAAEELQQLIQSLPQGYRTVFCLYVIDGYDHAEIAQQLGISENTSRTQLAKARNKLRTMLENIEHESTKSIG